MRSFRFPALLAASLIAHIVLAMALRHGAAGALSVPPSPPSPSSRTLVGETFDVPAPPVEEPVGAVSPSETPVTMETSSAATAATGPTTPTLANPSPPSIPKTNAASSSTATPNANANASRSATASSAAGADAPAASTTPSTSPKLYGATGVRFAVDLLETFGRQIPQASYRDPRWEQMAVGDAGRAEIALEIDDAGHLHEDVQVLGAPSPALRTAILGTVALIGGHAFTARALKSRLRITATITADTVYDDWHGKAFASSGVPQFVNDVAHAFFAYRGRRVDFTLQRLH